MFQEAAYDENDRVQVDTDFVAFPTGNYNIAEILSAELVTSETLFWGMNRNYVVPVVMGVATIFFVLAQSARGPGFYAVMLVLWIAVSLLSGRARSWVNDKRQMYTYSVALHTANGIITAYNSTDKRAVRRIVLEVNRAVDRYHEPEKDGHAPSQRPPRQHRAASKLKRRH